MPRQRFDAELLDAPLSDLDLLAANFRDMAAVNRYLGGNMAILRRVAHWIEELPPKYVPTILDIATGAADGPKVLTHWAATHGRTVRMVASDIEHNIIQLASRTLRNAPVVLVQHDALAMPFADRAIDIVTCTLALHHFTHDAAVILLREMVRVARVGVIVSDLRRCWGGYWGARLLALGPFHELSKHDGPLSVLRAYTRDEAQALLQIAGIDGTAYAEPVFRLSLEIAEHTRVIEVK
ncbi:MAG: methyltransferase domain-containing protein [Herpetosiphonaceae bacterium]|nr:methyltransferase domain-containing protein [Herpetosiphonaceae bacterium]